MAAAEVVVEGAVVDHMVVAMEEALEEAVVMEEDLVVVVEDMAEALADGGFRFQGHST